MTAKKHMEVPPEEEWLFLRNRNGDEHINACTDGYVSPKGEKPNVLEIHHALCVHACSDATLPEKTTKEQIDFIHNCLAITKWNINASDNNIGLPTKWAYVQHPEATDWDGLPCHQVDHDRYLKAVETYVTDNIWKSIREAQQAKECEQLKGDNLAQLFKDGSEEWKDFLKARGKELGGTKACFDYCLKDQKGKNATINDANWHIPFSMAPKGLIRSRVKPKGTKLERIGLLKAEIQ